MSDKLKHRSTGNRIAIRTINIKLLPTAEQVLILDKYINDFMRAHDRAINAYVESGNIKYLGIEGAKCDFITKEQRASLKQSLSEEGIFVDKRTHFSSVFSKPGAPTYFKTKVKAVIAALRQKDKRIKEIERDNLDLLKLNSVYFNEVGNIYGQTCSMCGSDEDIYHKSNENEEYLCDSCFEDFKQYRLSLKNINRRGGMEGLIFTQVMAALEAGQCSELLRKKFVQVKASQERDLKETGCKTRYSLVFTQSNKAMNWHQGSVVKKINFGKESTVTMSIADKKKEIEVQFHNSEYLTNFPKYGYKVRDNRYVHLIDQHINIEQGNTFVLREVKISGEKNYYLSVPTHYPIPITTRSSVGCIIVSNRKILIYINGEPAFIKLRNYYLRKIVYNTLKSRIQKENDKIIAENKKMLSAGKPIEPSKYLWMNFNEWLESNKPGDQLKNMPEKYTQGRLGKYIRFQTHLVSRDAVQIAKQMMKYPKIVAGLKRTETKSIITIDLTGIHTVESGVVTPIAALNNQINNKLIYDGIDGGMVNWNDIKGGMVCPECGTKIPETNKLNGNSRLILRDFILSKYKGNWECTCGYSINPLILVARNIMKLNESNKEDKI